MLKGCGIDSAAVAGTHTRCCGGGSAVCRSSGDILFDCSSGAAMANTASLHLRRHRCRSSSSLSLHLRRQVVVAIVVSVAVVFVIAINITSDGVIEMAKDVADRFGRKCFTVIA